MSRKEDEIMEFLTEILAGRILVTPTQDPGYVYAGNVRYMASNGCEVIVYNDCNAWDYVDSVIVDGRRFDAEFTWDRIHMSDEDAWRIWRIPGYLTYRCHGCGELVESPPNIEQEWLHCSNCLPENTDKEAPAPMPKKWELSARAREALKEGL